MVRKSNVVSQINQLLTNFSKLFGNLLRPFRERSRIFKRLFRTFYAEFLVVEQMDYLFDNFNIFGIVATPVSRISVRIELRKLTFPITQGALRNSKHLGYLLDIEIQFLHYL